MNNNTKWQQPYIIYYIKFLRFQIHFQSLKKKKKKRKETKSILLKQNNNIKTPHAIQMRSITIHNKNEEISSSPT